MAVQVSGKFKGTIIVPVDSDQDTVVEAAKASEKVAKAIAGMQIVKVIHVKNKLVNLIVKPCWAEFRIFSKIWGKIIDKPWFFSYNTTVSHVNDS